MLDLRSNNNENFEIYYIFIFSEVIEKLRLVITTINVGH